MFRSNFRKLTPFYYSSIRFCGVTGSIIGFIFSSPNVWTRDLELYTEPHLRSYEPIEKHEELILLDKYNHGDLYIRAMTRITCTLYGGTLGAVTCATFPISYLFMKYCHPLSIRDICILCISSRRF